MHENYLDMLRARQILKYRIRKILFRVIPIIAVLSAAYFGWASRSLIASSLGMIKQQVVSLGL